MDSKTLDLSGEITKEEYEAAITALGYYLCEVSYHEQWCRARHPYFVAIFPEYNRDNIYTEYERETPEEFIPDFTQTPDRPYGESLRIIRAHILWYARTNFISITKANTAFTRMGIPTYPDKVSPPVPRYQIYPGSIIVSANSPDMSEEEMHAWLATNAVTLIVNTLNGIPTEPNYTAPGSFEASGIHSEVYRLGPETITIAESDTIRPDYYRT